jgi:hypothetical protein
MKKSLIAAIAFAFATVSFASAMPAARAGQSTSSPTVKTTAKAKHHKKSSTKKSAASTSPTK